MNEIDFLSGMICCQMNQMQVSPAMTDFVYDNSLMAAEGETAMEQLMGITDKEYILAVEGAVATKN